MAELSFTDFVRSRRVTETPRGDFIDDTQMLIRLGRFPDPRSLDGLLWFMATRNACSEAVTAARGVWREYRRAVQ